MTVLITRLQILQLCRGMKEEYIISSNSNTKQNKSKYLDMKSASEEITHWLDSTDKSLI